jgi:alpha-tubulin suppressor-like RCC1 family protein
MVMHGVPTCLPGLTDIRISQVSANPLGSHVLLISYESLLFSYGLNDCGQLGIGTPETFVRNPTLVTAVLEGGGKTIACAGGTNYSLIVVKTSEQRVQTLRENQEHNLIDVQRVTSSSTARHPTSSFEMLRATSSPSRIDVKKSQDDPTVEHVEPSGEVIMDHHQVYGFGANDYFKLGLVNPPTDEKTILSLPHRVALHAKVWSGDDSTSDFPSAGVFGVAASVTHSAALVRRATGAIELYTWGQAQYGALGQSEEARVVSLPTRVAELSYTQSSNDATDVDSITYLRENEYPINVNLGPGCTFVTTNTGRCLSFGTNEDGLLGLGRNFEPEPTQLKFSDSDEYVASISVGARHAVATTAGGRVYTWGQDPASKRMLSRPEPLLSLNSVKAFAGYDLSAFVASSGLVQTCGTKSGRLGQGEVPPNPRVPTPLFGGLRLWQDEECPYA